MINKILFVILIAIMIPVLLPLLKPGFFPTQDFIHVARIYEMDVVLKDGQFPARWVPDFRYGEPLFNFYAPFPFYIGSLIHNFGFGFLNTTKILLGLGFVLSTLAMFYLGKELFGKWGGLISAALYLYAPYHSVDVYVRGAMSESLALIFFPLIFLSAYKLSKKQNVFNILFLAASLGGLFLTHNVMTVLFTPFAVGWVGFLIWSERKIRLVPHFALAFLLGFGLSATFLLPAFFEKSLVQSDSLITGYFDFRGHFVELWQFVVPFWGYGASLWGPEDGMSFQVGLVHLAAAVLSLILAIFFRRYKKFLALIVFLVLELTFSLFMQHNKSTPIWLAFPILAYTQFPWRFLGITIFIISLMGGALGYYLKNRWVISGLVIIIAAVVVNVNYFKPESYYLDSVDSHYVSAKVLNSEDKLPKDYLPKWVKTIALEKITAPHTKDGETIITDYQKRSASASFKAEVIKASDIEIPITYFPGWQIKANQQNITLEEPSNLGLIRVKLPPGNYQVQVQFINTPVRLIGNIISLLSWLILTFLLLRTILKLKWNIKLLF